MRDAKTNVLERIFFRRLCRVTLMARNDLFTPKLACIPNIFVIYTPKLTEKHWCGLFHLKLIIVPCSLWSISGLATTSALTAVGNKIPNVSTLVKKTDYDTNISELEKKLTDHKHDKYITTPEFNKLTAQNFAGRLTQANLIKKNRF